MEDVASTFLQDPEQLFPNASDKLKTDGIPAANITGLQGRKIAREFPKLTSLGL